MEDVGIQMDSSGIMAKGLQMGVQSKRAALDHERRKRWREHRAECARLWAAWEDRQRGYILKLWEPLPDLPELPDDLHDLTCGARTRAGTPCKRRDLFHNGRCRLHGGLSTGPLTPEGKQRSAMNSRFRSTRTSDQESSTKLAIGSGADE